MMKLQENEDVLNAYIGREVAPSTGTDHLQGFVRFEDQKTRVVVMGILGGRAFCEPARGTLKENKKYCLKEGNVLLDFDRRGSAEREKKSVDYRRLIKLSKTDINQVAEEYPKEYVMRKSTLETMYVEANILKSTVYEGDLHAKNFWIYGGPGVGKSKWARSVCPNYTLFKMMNKWWNGYSEEVKVILIEDWDPNCSALTHML
jgi:hypothetical protein